MGRINSQLENACLIGVRLALKTRKQAMRRKVTSRFIHIMASQSAILSVGVPDVNVEYLAYITLLIKSLS